MSNCCIFAIWGSTLTFYSLGAFLKWNKRIHQLILALSNEKLSSFWNTLLYVVAADGFRMKGSCLWKLPPPVCLTPFQAGKVFPWSAGSPFSKWFVRSVNASRRVSEASCCWGGPKCLALSFPPVWLRALFLLGDTFTGRDNERFDSSTWCSVRVKVEKSEGEPHWNKIFQGVCVWGGSLLLI